MNPASRAARASTSVMHDLAHTTSRLVEVSDRSDVLHAVVEAALRLLGADAVHLGTLDRRRGVLQVLVNGDPVGEWELPLSETDLLLFADYPRLIQADETTPASRASLEDPHLNRYNRALLTDLSARYAMSVRVLVGGASWGELFVSRSNAFTDEEEHAAVVLTGVLSAKLAQLDDTERLADLAYTDALTGLFNRRMADEKLQGWAADPRRRESMAVALCDVNELKQVNDRLGHSVGDQLLGELGELVVSAARRLPSGIAARIGGDEFLLAGLCTSEAQLSEVVADLTVASHELPLGNGLSCGIAWAGNLARVEATPVDHTSALLRLADVGQYEHKRSRRRAAVLAAPRDATGPSRTDSVVISPDESLEDGDSVRLDVASDDRLAAEVTLLLRRLRTDHTAESLERLVDVSSTVCELTGAAAWWVSSVDVVAGTVVACRCGTPRSAGQSDGQWPTVVVDPHAYRLADYPATAAILSGGSFAVDTHHGDPAERRLLVQTGFASMVAATAVEPGGVTWLVEVYGDSLTSDLRRHQSLLEALTTAALPPPR